MKGEKLKGGQPAGGGWKASLAAVLKAHNGAKVDGSVASYATRDKRADVPYAGFKLLRELGYKLDTVHSFRGKHMEVIATQDQSWTAAGVDVAAKIAEMVEKDARVGLQVALQAVFGLRARGESCARTSPTRAFIWL